MDSTQIFMPLRSNGSWFNSEQTLSNLERQFKLHAILYDEIAVEDGRLQVTIGEDGQGMQQTFPGNSYGDRTAISFAEQGSPFGLSLDDVPVLQSTTFTAYDIDFFPILNRANWLDAPFIRHVDAKLNKEGEKLVDNESRRVLCDESMEGLPQNGYLREFVLKSLLRDAFIAQAEGIPLCVDSNIATAVANCARILNPCFNFAMADVVYESWIDISMPDFAMMHWDDVRELRDSAAGQDFRKLVHRIASEGTAALGNYSEEKARAWISQQLGSILMQELRSRSKTTGDVVFSITTNIVPLGAFVDIGRELYEFKREQASWVSLLNRRMKPNA